MANVQLTLNQTVSGVTVQNVMNWQMPAVGAVDFQELANVIRTRFSVNVLDSFGDEWFLNDINFRVYDGGAPFSSVVGFTAGPLQGTSLVEALPRQTALLVSLSYTGPRPNRGRQFYGGLAENAWDGDSWDATTITDFQALWSDFINGLVITSGTCFPRIARVDDATNTWILNNPVENALVRPYAATQKGRRS